MILRRWTCIIPFSNVQKNRRIWQERFLLKQKAYSKQKAHISTESFVNYTITCYTTASLKNPSHDNQSALIPFKNQLVCLYSKISFQSISCYVFSCIWGLKPQWISILPSKEKCATVRHIHGHSLFETSSSLTHEQALGLSLRGLIEAKYDHVERPHLDNDISREKKDSKEEQISFEEAMHMYEYKHGITDKVSDIR